MFRSSLGVQSATWLRLAALHTTGTNSLTQTSRALYRTVLCVAQRFGIGFASALSSSRRTGLCVLFGWCAVLVSTSASNAIAQQTADIIRGHVTGPDGQPVQGVQVRALSYVGGIEKITRTDKNGRYSIVYPNGEGDYWLQFNEIGFQGQRFELKRRADEDVLIADAKLSHTQDLQAVTVTASGRHLTIARNDNYQDITGVDKSITTGFATVNPNAIGDLAAQAAALPGVQFIPGVDGAPDRFSIFGLAGDQNNATLNGMQQEFSRLPRDANLSLQLRTGYDITTGGASGATIAVNTVSGTNQIGRRFSMLLNAPQVQWNDVAGRASQYGSVSLSGSTTGPRVMDKDFYNVSFQVDHRAQDLSTLVSSTPALFQSAGIAVDSAAHLLSILRALRIPASSASTGANTDQNLATALGSFDWASKSPSSGNAVTVAFNGTFSSNGPSAVSPLSTGASLASSESGSGGVLMRHTNFFSSGMLTESVLSVSGSGRATTPELNLPSGNVVVTSLLDNGAQGVSSLSFGGASLAQQSSSYSAGARNVLSRISENNKHRIKLLSELRADFTQLDPAQNLLGHFTYQSLADLEANHPSSYTRHVGDADIHGSSLVGTLGLSDSWRVNRDLQLQYGVRADAQRFLTAPILNPDLQSVLGARNSNVPNRVYVSPRFGFSREFNDSHGVVLTSGYYGDTDPSVLSGGIGLFQNVNGPGLISNAIANTGISDASGIVRCVGNATPNVDWSALVARPQSAPTQCADGSVNSLGSRAPDVSFLSAKFMQPTSLRSTLNYYTSRFEIYRITTNVLYSYNFNQPDATDINLRPLRRFALPDESERPVYVAAPSIDPSSGIASTSGSRISQEFGVVSQSESRLRSQTAQLSLAVIQLPIDRRLSFELSYAYLYTRQQFRDVSNRNGNPTAISSALGRSPQHDLGVTLHALFGNYASVSIYGRLTSGTRFTPLVAGDVNGDGNASNDRAFVFDAARVNDPAFAGALRGLYANGSNAARTCLRDQLNTIAAQNSCTGPWTIGYSQAQLVMNSARIALPQRMILSFTLSNPVGAADLLLHGSNKAHGWGQTPDIDQTLLYVRGFDAATSKYSYQVNQRFGAFNSVNVLSRTPVVITARLSVNLAPRRDWQDLYQAIERGRSRVGVKMNEAATRQYGRTNGSLFYSDPMGILLSRSEYLHLQRWQADSLARVSKRYARLIDSLWTPFAKKMATLPNDYDHRAIERQLVSIQVAVLDYLVQVVPHIREMLTQGQLKSIDPNARAYSLDASFWRQRKQGLTTTFGIYSLP